MITDGKLCVVCERDQQAGGDVEVGVYVRLSNANASPVYYLIEPSMIDAPEKIQNIDVDGTMSCDRQPGRRYAVRSAASIGFMTDHLKQLVVGTDLSEKVSRDYSLSQIDIQQKNCAAFIERQKKVLENFREEERKYIVAKEQLDHYNDQLYCLSALEPCEFEYVYGYHTDDAERKEYAWSVPSKLFGKISVGDTCMVATSRGHQHMVVSRVERTKQWLNHRPVIEVCRGGIVHE